MEFIHYKTNIVSLFFVDENIDCIKFPDNFPALFTSDVYRVGALRKTANIEYLESKWHIHPKYFMEFDKNSHHLHFPRRFTIHATDLNINNGLFKNSPKESSRNAFTSSKSA